MPKVALFIKHKVKPGQRDNARKVWERQMQPKIATNPSHKAYYYCLMTEPSI